MAGYVVVGAQWGDEGKGKIVDVLGEKADYVVRFQGAIMPDIPLLSTVRKVFSICFLQVYFTKMRYALSGRVWLSIPLYCLKKSMYWKRKVCQAAIFTSVTAHI